MRAGSPPPAQKNTGAMPGLSSVDDEEGPEAEKDLHKKREGKNKRKTKEEKRKK